MSILRAAACLAPFSASSLGRETGISPSDFSAGRKVEQQLQPTMLGKHAVGTTRLQSRDSQQVCQIVIQEVILAPPRSHTWSGSPGKPTMLGKHIVGTTRVRSRASKQVCQVVRPEVILGDEAHAASRPCSGNTSLETPGSESEAPSRSAR